MVILATDAPLSPRNLKRIARRAVLGLARTGSFMSHGSGDFVIAFSTRNRVPYAPKSTTRTVEEVQDDFVSPLFLATVEAVEEAVLNSLFKAETMDGREGHRLDAFPFGEFEKMIRSTSSSP
jgi:D-aminopeptidase